METRSLFFIQKPSGKKKKVSIMEFFWDFCVVPRTGESGEGFADILIEPEDLDSRIIIELKYSQTFAGLEKACERVIV